MLFRIKAESLQNMADTLGQALGKKGMFLQEGDWELPSGSTPLVEGQKSEGTEGEMQFWRHQPDP